MYLGHVSGRKVVPDCRRLGSSASDCRLQKGYPLCACQHTDKAVTSSNLTEHMRKHTGVKPYACSHCSYKSTLKGNLGRHKLTHSGAKPFSCDDCPYKTAQKSNLTSHLKVCKHAPGPFVPL